METQVTLTMQDQHQASVLQLLDSSRTSVGQAAQLLDCSERQVYRKLAAYRAQGVGAVPHGNRGRTPHNALDPKLRAEVLGLLRSDAYRPLNTHHLAEILAENEGIHLSVSTLRRLRIAAGVTSPRKRRSPKAHPLRDRKPGEGMMLQIDGSKHLWFGPDGGLCVLIWAIDDATGRVCGALFRAEEDCVGYMLMLRQIIGKHGVPLSLYADRHSIFRPAAADKLTIEQQLAGQRKPMSQFGRAMAQLGIQQIAAHSAQAKGRVERSFATAQDRLLQEMRLNKITTIEQANAFLPRFIERYNRNFAKPAADPNPAWRPALSQAETDAALCLQYQRRADNANAISFGGRRLTVAGPQRSFARKQIQIRVALDGQFSYHYQGEIIGQGPRAEGELRTDESELAKLLPAPAPTISTGPETPRRKPPREPVSVTPAPDHPWRKQAIGHKTRS
jgi:transposase